MIRRANKITSLVLAAAAVVSMVPAYAADVKKVESKDGTIYGAVAYKNGTAVIDAEVNDNDGVYLYKDGKYNKLNDIDSGSDLAAYGTKYAKVDDGSDYNVDLETGKVLDDNIVSDDEDDAASALRKRIKNEDRYSDTKIGSAYGDNDIADLTLIDGNKFGGNWYETAYAVDSSHKTSNPVGVPLNAYTIFTDAKGNYIDADYNIGKIKVSTTSAGIVGVNQVTTSAAVTIENTKDGYKLRNSNDTYAAITQSRVLGQDKDNIYRYAKINVYSVADSNGYFNINGKPMAKTGVATFGTSTVDYITLDVIQKISKKQDSSDINGGKYANSVTNYILTNDDGGAATSDNLSFRNFVLNFDNYSKQSNTVVGARVISGKLVLFKVDNSSNLSGDNVMIQAATLKNKNGYYYADSENQNTIQAEYSKYLDKVAFDTDVDGNIYIIDGGYIKKFDGTDDWNKLYKVDGSLDALSVYDKDDMVAWSQNDEVYSIIGEKKSDDNKPDVDTPVVTVGWVQASDGSWSYNNADGSKAIGWVQDGSNWYYTNGAGVMQTGWLNLYGTWYYLNPTSDGTRGAMKTGWQYIGGTWYYLNPISDGTKGAMKTGWQYIGGAWYYFNWSGAMLANTTVDGYVLGSSGAWIR
ncbi:hypothetical protein B0P06_001087 [Clostridium saccharoperbutylacetonicum]|uniref:Putative cell wall binding repeat-containing protein n=1 Tax=Clostridium saccharoperbutylacetonicum N1-4(HMT) TaxID=931276 RepID=M1LPQ2_9CLOT|nr:N-acetylmuramoyl-L-alanine amidase family protein [Clostridium saccharoperbutylacetonicum]AGF54835.1 putative cell wall binding repeat-containing protein [Clostridium saccharoperbutylacetonicum N1-4(HMT)]NRT64460.1 hypothetical protein [Clostridium saccharoperbutylacetonicum]NSB27831.1 hypothetical protein [Clostridium saccharoperbutylacetonicum]NSB41316.1 hypothetical protein [Clostridium saccharoperbutylacetonicum]